MSDISTQKGTVGSIDGLVPGVPGWVTTPTLLALQELVEVAETVPSAVARRAGLSATELHALRHLVRGPMGPVELAKSLGFVASTQAMVMQLYCETLQRFRLAARGHATREAHPDDGRRTEVLITDSGRQEVLQRMRPMFEGLATMDASLTDEERLVVERYLRGAIHAMRSLL